MLLVSSEQWTVLWMEMGKNANSVRMNETRMPKITRNQTQTKNGKLARTQTELSMFLIRQML